MVRSLPLNPKHACALATPTSDGIHPNLEVVESEGGQASSAQVDIALRMLARMMIQAHQESDHSKVNARRRKESSSLTLLPTASPHDWNDRTA